ncbi:MAG TPA: hypothetical protein VN213_20230 [Solirubrobacteraceae bacterium]|nr:hypothetical protein [Solirubrobacteraceae bacterium]
MNTVRDCKCGRRLLMELNEGTCLLCGHGHVATGPASAYATSRTPRLRRLPRNLGDFHREGRRVDPRCDNVIPRLRRAA